MAGGPLTVYAKALMRAARAVAEHEELRHNAARRLREDPARRAEIRGALRALTDPAMGNAGVAINVPIQALPGLEESGRFKSQFETGTSEGLYDPTVRSLAEEQLFGYPNPSRRDNAQRPIYGYLYDRDAPYSHLLYEPSTNFPIYSGAAPMEWGISMLHPTKYYGSLRFDLRPEVLERATFTLGDSLDLHSVPFPAGGNPRLSNDLIDNLRGLPATRKTALHAVNPYLEAQIHGGVTLDDVLRANVLTKDAAPFELRTLENLEKRHGWEPTRVRPMPPEYDLLRSLIGDPMADVISKVPPEYPDIYKDLVRRTSSYQREHLDLPLSEVYPPWKRGGRVTP